MATPPGLKRPAPFPPCAACVDGRVMASKGKGSGGQVRRTAHQLVYEEPEVTGTQRICPGVPFGDLQLPTFVKDGEPTDDDKAVAAFLEACGQGDRQETSAVVEVSADGTPLVGSTDAGASATHPQQAGDFRLY